MSMLSAAVPLRLVLVLLGFGVSWLSNLMAMAHQNCWEESEGNDLIRESPLDLSAEPAESKEDPAAAVMEATSQKLACPARRERPWTGQRGRNQLKDRRRRRQRKELGEKGEERKTKALQIYSKLQEGNEAARPSKSSSCSRFED
ncbi:hypothetical protein MHYP_G00313560 [Metynnis hypsauchen]